MNKFPHPTGAGPVAVGATWRRPTLPVLAGAGVLAPLLALAVRLRAPLLAAATLVGAGPLPSAVGVKGAQSRTWPSRRACRTRGSVG
jgi:hypothetical protein